MIEAIAARIPRELFPISGKVFYSGRAAFSSPRPVYLLGFNPGGAPQTHVSETVESHTNFVLSTAPEEWSAYSDESWKGKSTGTAPLQVRVRHLLNRLGLDVRHVPGSNLIFTRSARSAHLGLDRASLIDLCWPVHDAVLAALRPKAVICLGKSTGEKVSGRVGAKEEIDRFCERNGRRWKSVAWRSPSGLLVFGLSHPAIADWTNPATDPSPMVSELLSRRGEGDFSSDRPVVTTPTVGLARSGG